MKAFVGRGSRKEARRRRREARDARWLARRRARERRRDETHTFGRPWARILSILTLMAAMAVGGATAWALEAFEGAGFLVMAASAVVGCTLALRSPLWLHGYWRRRHRAIVTRAVTAFAYDMDRHMALLTDDYPFRWEFNLSFSRPVDDPEKVKNAVLGMGADGARWRDTSNLVCRSRELFVGLSHRGGFSTIYQSNHPARKWILRMLRRFSRLDPRVKRVELFHGDGQYQSLNRSAAPHAPPEVLEHLRSYASRARKAEL